MGPTWGPSGADRTQVGPMLAPWTLLSGWVTESDCDIEGISSSQMFCTNALSYSAVLTQFPLGEVANFISISTLTPRGQVTHICVSKMIFIGSDNGLSPSHYLNQCWNVVNSKLKKFQWDLKQSSYIFIHKNACENIVWKMAAILSRPQYAKHI